MVKKNARKWNRSNTFRRQKSNHDRVGHPVLVYGRSKQFRKYLIFTHTPEVGHENEYEELKYNIDPNEKDKKTYVGKRPRVSEERSLSKPDKKYRIHEIDKPTIKKYKK